MSTPPAEADFQRVALTSPAGLALATDRSFRYPPHLRLVDRAIVDAVERAQVKLKAGEWKRPEILLVEMPPRHGKSTLISEHTPAWFFGRCPDSRVILCSYQAEFAQSWGWRARNKLEEYGPRLYGVRVNPQSRSAKRWRIQGRKGGMLTAGVGGPITGEGAHLFIVDDPIKNAEEAMSEVIREKQTEWWRSTARTRLEPGAVVVVLMTRWHWGDLGGFLLRESEDGGDPVTELRLPALAEAGDPLGREPGEALWPERYDEEALAHLRQVLGAYWFSAMFQGTPTPDEGGIFARRDFRYFDIQGDRAILYDKDGREIKQVGLDWCQKFQVADLAASEKQTADYTVVAEVLVTPDREMLIRQVVRDRIAGPDQPGFFRAHHTGAPLKVEGTGAYGTSIVQGLQRAGMPVEPVYPDADKVTRASSAGVLYRQERVFHLRGAEWLHDFELELLAFPAGEHDDQVDVVAYAAKALPGITIRRPRKDESRRRESVKRKQF